MQPPWQASEPDWLSPAQLSTTSPALPVTCCLLSLERWTPSTCLCLRSQRSDWLSS